MIKIWNWIRENPNRAMFLVPIILVAFISISHVVTWYDMANPINWAIYLSIAIEIAAMTALVAVDSKIKGGIWFMFGLVTLIQVMGNVFYCYKEIDSDGVLFKSWVELTSPVWELVGTEITDVISLKRWLAFLEGGLLPIISLTSLHFFITYKVDKTKESDGYFEDRNRELEKVVMSKPEGKEFNTPYPFTDEMKEANKKSDESIVEEVAEDDYDSEGNLNYTPPEPKSPVDEEKEKEEEIEKAREKAEEWAIKESEDKRKFEEKKKSETSQNKKKITKKSGGKRQNSHLPTKSSKYKFKRKRID